MGEMGKAMMGTGEAEGPDRARVAAESAISNPLLEDHSMKGARGVLINITGGLDMTLHEVDEAANRIREEVDQDANIIFGSTFDASMQGRMRVSVVSTGISAMAAQAPAPNYLNLDVNRPVVQTGQPALSRPTVPVGRVAMPAAAVAAPIPTAPPAPMMPVAPVAPPPAPVAAPAQVMMEAPAPIVDEAPPAPVGFAPVEEAAYAPPPAPAPIAATLAPAPAPIAAPAAAPAPAPQKPLVDEHDWRVSRPATRPMVRANEPIARPTVARPAGGDRSPNLFQRITGAFSAPKATPAAPAPTVEPSVARTAAPAAQPENVVAVAPKPAPRPAPAQPSMDVTERAKPARDDDDLQIPAFLRRQAN
jgi:cell division protein FtsZ